METSVKASRADPQARHKLLPGGDFFDDNFDAWVDQLTRAPAKLLEPRGAPGMRVFEAKTHG